MHASTVAFTRFARFLSSTFWSPTFLASALHARTLTWQLYHGFSLFVRAIRVDGPCGAFIFRTYITCIHIYIYTHVHTYMYLHIYIYIYIYIIHIDGDVLVFKLISLACPPSKAQQCFVLRLLLTAVLLQLSRFPKWGLQRGGQLNLQYPLSLAYRHQP